MATDVSVCSLCRGIGLNLVPRAIYRSCASWVPEGSLGLFFWCQAIFVKLVCGPDYCCNRQCKTHPSRETPGDVDMDTVPGPARPQKRTPRKRPDCLQIFEGHIFEVWPAPGPRESFKKVGGEPPRILGALPGPLGPAKPQKRTQKHPARLPSGTE
jgi:hypothetical protein